MIRLLAADDSALMRRVLGEIFAAEPDFEVAFARDGVDALDQVRSFRPDVVTLDVQMPRMDGLTCLQRIMAEAPCPVVMLSSLTHADAEAALQALEMGAVDVMPKPDGTVSLAIDDLAPVLVAKVRAAAGARLRKARRPPPRTDADTRPAPTHRTRSKTTSAVTTGLVLVGVSTGGPPALETLIGALPADFPWAVLVAQHMPARFTASLAQRLDGFCALPVSEVASPTLLQAGTVYIGRGDADLIVSRRQAGLIAMSAPASPEHRWHPSVERLVTSAAAHAPPEALLGVMLTGMGHDGASAMTELFNKGGRTIAEAESTAVVWGMPGELVRQGGAEVVLPLEQIAARLVAWTAR